MDSVVMMSAIAAKRTVDALLLSSGLGSFPTTRKVTMNCQVGCQPTQSGALSEARLPGSIRTLSRRTGSAVGFGPRSSRRLAAKLFDASLETLHPTPLIERGRALRANLLQRVGRIDAAVS